MIALSNSDPCGKHGSQKGSIVLKPSVHKRLLALLLALAMVFSVVPVSVLAEGEQAAYAKVALSDASDLTAGAYLMYGMRGR